MRLPPEAARSGDTAAALARIASESVGSLDCLRLVEGFEHRPALTARHLSVIQAQAPQTLRRAGLSMTYVHTGGRIEAFLEAGTKVGTLRLNSPHGALEVIVEPKIGEMRLFGILDAILARPQSLGTLSTALVSGGPTSSLLLEHVVAAVTAFLLANVYRDFALVTDRESSRPRGRIDVLQHVARDRPRLRYHTLPCTYPELSVDIAENRLIATALDMAARMCAHLPRDARVALSQRIVFARGLLRGVSSWNPSEMPLQPLQYTTRNRHFRDVHDLCWLLLDNADVSLSAGRKVSFSSFVLSMPDIFERFIRTIIARHVGSACFPEKSRLKFTLGIPFGHTILDGLLMLPEGRIVVECKYKTLDTSALESGLSGGIIRDDLYQVVAYATQSGVDAAGACLVYPAAAPLGACARIIAETHAFRRSPGTGIPVRIVAVDLRRPVEDLQKGLPGLLS